MQLGSLVDNCHPEVDFHLKLRITERNTLIRIRYKRMDG